MSSPWKQGGVCPDGSKMLIFVLLGRIHHPTAQQGSHPTISKTIHLLCFYNIHHLVCPILSKAVYLQCFSNIHHLMADGLTGWGRGGVCPIFQKPLYLMCFSCIHYLQSWPGPQNHAFRAYALRRPSMARRPARPSAHGSRTFLCLTPAHKH